MNASTTSIDYDASVLLIDDDQYDIFKIQRIIEAAPINIRLESQTNGKKALEYLERTERANDSELPDLLLLDLNMPVMDGNAFLKELREHPALRGLPVCILTGYANKVSTEEAYKNGANAVISKDDAKVSMGIVVHQIIDFWFSTATRYYTD